MTQTFPLEVIACPQQCDTNIFLDGGVIAYQVGGVVYEEDFGPPKKCSTCGGVGKVRIQKLEGAE